MRMLIRAMSLALSLFVAGCVTASEGVEELLRVFKAHEDAVINYVRNSPEPYSFSTEDYRFLMDSGVSQRIIAEAIEHGRRLREQSAISVTETVAVAPVVAPPPEDTNISFFYDALSPHGNWVEVDGTWVWHPACANTDPHWRPYCDSGHWVYTDSGWAWHSEYSWGWAPFHYGRWSYHVHHGWIWAPDTVWSPAWVNWRVSDSHYGWAPLPPAARFDVGVGFHFGGRHVDVDINFGLGERDYCFIPAEHMCEPHVNSYVVPASQVSVVYNRTTIIQNNIVYNDNRIINRGPALEHVRAVTHQNIQVVRISDAAVQPGQPIHGNILSGNTFVVYRPQVKNVAPVTPPAALARREAAQLRHETTQDIRSQRIENVAARTADRRETNFAAKQQVLDARTEAHDAKKEETSAEAVARLRARENEANAKRVAAEHEGVARPEIREVNRAAPVAPAPVAEVKHVETSAEAQARIRAADAAAMARERAAEVRHEEVQTRRSESQAELQAKAQAQANQHAELQRQQQAAAEAQARAAAREKALEAEKADAAAKAVAHEKALEAERQAKLQNAVARQQAEAQHKAEAEAIAEARKEGRVAKKEETKAEKEARKKKEQDPNGPAQPVN